ncbi:hypothetical protein [Alkalihalobacillus trypoxylicola]|uniref:Uncharacterized protein n=1 Tax=Alkalihalobacillus trypoxylicola TaxID=519424 RepID=A0A161PCX6_9BACI|nr:hypothetical protein [Alkalihalobacillus trypoxylicola]KYG25515.1 hypothetical protein AZF04_13570 [Alkalihalobacillus trypoxylicola]
MIKKIIAAMTAFLALFMFSFQSVLAAGGGEEEVTQAATLGMTNILLIILSVATIITMIYLLIRDNG